MELTPNKHIHFVGIGGVGMSAIAQVLLEKGLRVTGSDKHENIYTIRLAALGAKIFVGHQAQYVRGAEALVYSSAIRPENPEFKYAKKNQIPIIPRARMLGYLLSEAQRSIAVTGTHGKTTTSAMVTMLLRAAGHRPTFMVGGELNELGTNAALGDTHFAVAEADESDGSFLELKPHIEIITNMEMEHCDFYPTMDDVYRGYAKFVECLSVDGRLVLQGDHPNAQTFLKRLGDRAIETFGFDPECCDLWADQITYPRGKTRFCAHQAGRCLGEVELQVIGRHNVLNALAAMQVVMREGVPFDVAAAALGQFTGTKRRFQFIGQMGNIAIYDDYAHHPTEVATTLEAAKNSLQRRVICVFQPHRFSRVQALREQFRHCFDIADEVIVTAVYSAGEDPIDGVNGELLAETVRESGKSVHFINRKNLIPDYLLSQVLKAGDVLLVMGAGDIHTVAKETLHRLKKQNKISGVAAQAILPPAVFPAPVAV